MVDDLMFNDSLGPSPDPGLTSTPVDSCFDLLRVWVCDSFYQEPHLYKGAYLDLVALGPTAQCREFLHGAQTYYT